MEKGCRQPATRQPARPVRRGNGPTYVTEWARRVRRGCGRTGRSAGADRRRHPWSLPSVVHGQKQGRTAEHGRHRHGGPGHPTEKHCRTIPRKPSRVAAVIGRHAGGLSSATGGPRGARRRLLVRTTASKERARGRRGAAELRPSGWFQSGAEPGASGADTWLLRRRWQVHDGPADGRDSRYAQGPRPRRSSARAVARRGFTGQHPEVASSTHKR